MTRRTLGVAVVGFGWMGRVHTQAYARVRHHFPELALIPRPVAVAEADPHRRDGAVEQYGFDYGTARWSDLAGDPRVQAVSITSPNMTHRDIATALARAGKHIWIEKPVGLSAADAAAVAAAAADAGVRCTVGFNYRNAPAVVQARELIAAGAIGTITHARFRLFSDYAAHPHGALTWRFAREQGGSGVLGDLGSHGVDLVRHLLGEIESVVADTAVIVAQRPRPVGATSHFARGGGEPGPVENEDYLAALLRLTGGARVTLEASRVSVGSQNDYGFEIHGTTGALHWDFRRMGELGVSRGEAYQDQMTTTVFAGPGDGAYAAFQPASGIAMGYDDLKVIEAAAFLRSIADGTGYGAGIDDAVRAAQVLEAVAESAATGTRVTMSR